MQLWKKYLKKERNFKNENISTTKLRQMREMKRAGGGGEREKGFGWWKLTLNKRWTFQPMEKGMKRQEKRKNGKNEEK